MKRKIAFTFEGESIEVVAERIGNLLTVQRGDQVYHVELEPERSSSEEGSAEKPPAPPAWGTAPAAPDRPSGRIVATGGSGAVPAPMTGTIKEVLVHVGDTVQENEQIIMMEAMKMDIEVVAPQAGKVAEIMVAPGDSVKENQMVLRIE
jgi:glutaconyl-CoA/methylmalonyl-CoA decarboxylase subunit gamma